MILVVIISVVVEIALLAWMWWRFEKRIAKIEVSVVRQIMEESPELADKVVELQYKLRTGGNLDPGRALAEARRLLGLPT